MSSWATLPLPAQTEQQWVDRTTEPLDENQRVTLEGNVHPLAQARFDQGPAPASMPTGRIMLVLRRSLAQQQALERYLAALHDPSSPSYHKWLTPAQYGATFGMTDSDRDILEAWLESHGFRIEKVPQARNVILFSGTVDQVQSAFHTAIHKFVVNGETHYANVNDPQIPAALAPAIAGIAPLNDFRPKANAELGPPGRYDLATHSIRPELTQSGPMFFMVPADAATIYDTPNAALNPNYTGTTYDGTSVNIGIVSDSNVTMQDIQNYRVAFLGETPATANLPTVVVDGNDPLINDDEAQALLDVEIVGGIALKAKIFLYTSSGWYNALFRALDDNTVSILNISASACEEGLGNSGNEATLEWAEQAAAQGISVTVSSGDTGSAGCNPPLEPAAFMGGLAVNGLASTPWTIAVGGTDFDVLSTEFSTYVDTTSGSAPYYRTAKSYIPEEPWNDSTSVNTSIADNVANVYSSGSTNILAAGGGPSSCATQNGSGECSGGYAKPPFQLSLTLNDSVRDLPDVSLFAANGLYQAVWAVCADNVANGDTSSAYTDCQTSNGQLVSGAHISSYGGTDAAAPAFAGMLALVAQAQGGERLGQADYVLYRLAQTKYGTVFHDITTGDNSVVCVRGSSGCGTNDFMTGYNAGANYDLASGLGSVDAAAMVNNWSSVSLSPTSTTLEINGSTATLTAAHGTPLTFNVGVTPSTATGVAGIIDTANEVTGGPLLNGQFAIPLSSGMGSATWNGLPGGTYSVSARYSGDGSNAASTSPPIHVTITPENSATTLKVIGADVFNALVFICPCTLWYGQAYISAQAQISGTSADELKNGTQGVATGTVTFNNGNSTLATAADSSQNLAETSWPPASSPSAFLPAGSYIITANYSGDASFKPSASSAIAVTVNQTGTATSAAASSSSISESGSTAITANVSAMSAGAYPTGSVALAANGKALATITSFTQGNPSGGTLTLGIQGSAAITGSQLAYGANTITATYSGDNNYISSSGTVSVNVTGSPSFGFSLSNSGNISVNLNASNTATITATPAGGFTGRVNLSCALTSLPNNPYGPVVPPTCSIPPSVTISGSSVATATLTVSATSSTTGGVYMVTIAGTDAATGAIMANTALSVTVNVPYGFTMTNTGNITVNPGANGSTSVTLIPTGGFSGTVNLTCTVTTSIPNPVDPPTCSMPSSVTLASNPPEESNVPVNIATTAGSGGPLNLSLKPLFLASWGVALAMLLFFCLPVRRRRWCLLLGLLVLILSMDVLGCGGGGSSAGQPPPGGGGTTPGAYTVTVTGTDAATGKITASTTVTITVL